jgi:alkanesulfonate monooxygenase SsuD/methylene tetrahydromethanopterin reductase-like flavin-dependent oxidoreductase (luciferase family)
MGLGCFVSVGRSLDQAVTRVKLAEELGYESVYVTHINGRESLTVLTHYAAHTDRVRLGTGVVPIYTRTPATMAQTAATIDEVSGGRLVLGLGVSHRPVVEGWHGQTIDKPGRRCASTSRSCARSRRRGAAAGAKWQTGFQLGMPVRPTCRSTSPRCRRRCSRPPARSPTASSCGCATRTTSATSSCPEVTKGREKAGKTLEGFDIVAAVPSALTDDEADAYATMRKDLLPYFGLPFYRAMLERSGFGADIAASTRRPDAATATRCSGDLRGLPRGLTAVGTAVDGPRGRRALPGGRRDVAVRRPDPEDRLRVDPARRRARWPTALQAVVGCSSCAALARRRATAAASGSRTRARR